MVSLLSDSPNECYESILSCVKDAQDEVNKHSKNHAEINWTFYTQKLEEGRHQLLEVLTLIPEWTNNQGNLLGLNLRLLNNYYKHLFRRAIEDRDLEALYELKYHLMELIAAWKC